MPETALIQWVTTLFSFLLVFRTSQAYSRFQGGSNLVTKMMSDFSDSTALLLCLSRAARSDETTVREFRHTLIRLVSLLNLLCLSELAHHGEVELDHIYTDKLIDAEGLGTPVFRAIRKAYCKQEVVFTYIQNLIADNLQRALNIPPPLLTRAIAEFGTGMVKFHDAMELVHIPFPFTYLMFTELFSTVLWFLTPFSIAKWSQGPIGAGLWTMLLILVIWSLIDMAAELDMPFGESVNDLDFGSIQTDFNERLLSLLETSFVDGASLNEEAVLSFDMLRHDRDWAEPNKRSSREVRVATNKLGNFGEEMHSDNSTLRDIMGPKNNDGRPVPPRMKTQQTIQDLAGK
jgi:predicted membrane chloride channel (bestrophin family)